ncbi:hypothetical protein [Azospirillum soli]|uniref:hypothetical protein n=1 Tax=Azospirillum soli TaxID=1304799 RepID=UPI001AE7A36E|nr:hypothetical protein [Azospirillum soli]MBP2311507.1 hypothetical protein [Azospirillum soli]
MDERAGLVQDFDRFDAVMDTSVSTGDPWDVSLNLGTVRRQVQMAALALRGSILSVPITFVLASAAAAPYKPASVPD